MDLKKLFEVKDSSKLQRRVGIALIILIILFVVWSGLIFYFYAKPCQDNDCFVDAMIKCKKVSLIREDAQASWLYTIIGSNSDNCEVEVELRNINQGTIDNEKLQGKKMLCLIPKAGTQFPEKDISKCSGVLKEELQDVIIKRMHDYLLENFGEIKQEFEGL